MSELISDSKARATVSKRLFIGGLATIITAKELEDRFSSFGKISDLNLTVRKDDSGNPFKCFAHLNIEGDETNIKRCFDAYQNSKWKGSILKLQYAKENFVSRLQKERESEKQTSPTSNQTEECSTTPEWTPLQFEAIKGAGVPGTLVPGKKDWVVGKYGRILPILKVKKSSKTVKHDPSKLCHAMKVFKEDTQGSDPEDTQCSSLTWDIDTPDSDITRKRKGQFPSPSNPKRRKSDPTKQVRQFLDSLEAQRAHEKDLEIVSLRQNSLSKQSEISLKSNKFDSDRESDSDNDDDGSRTQNSLNNSLNSAKPQRKSTEKDMKVQRMVSATNQTPVKFTQISDENSMPEFKGLNSLGAKTVCDSLTPVCDSHVTNSPKKFERGKKTMIYNESVIPEFKGLGMISSECLGETAVKKISPSPQKETSVEKLETVFSSPQKETAVKKISPSPQKEISYSSVQQNQEKTHHSDKETEKMRTNANLTSKEQPVHGSISKNEPLTPTRTPGTEKKSKNRKLSLLTEHTVKFSDESNHDDSDDSVSSADSYEIIARKKRKSMSHEERMGKDRVDQNALRVKSSNVQEKGKILKSPGRDHSLCFSEFEAGTLDEIEQDEDDRTKASDDSHDSDLDDNDFELVAKKLAEKAGIAKSKFTKKQKQMPVSSALANERSNSSESQPNKKVASNERRLQAVKEQMKTKQRQQAAMHKALSNVDSAGKHKIVFSSDDDDENESMNTSLPNTNPSESTLKPKPTLFDESDSESDEDSEDMFRSRPQFEGKKGEKLMQLERKIGDKRFTLDEKFAESDSEEEEEETKEEAEASTANPLKEERAANIKVLENVIGKSKLDQFTAKIKRNTKHIIDMNTVRFDPTKLKPQAANPAAQSTGKNKIDLDRLKTEPSKLKRDSEERKDKDASSDVIPKPKQVEFLDLSKEKQKQKVSQDSTSASAKSDSDKLKEGKLDKGKKHEEKSKSGTKSTVELSSSLVSLFKKTEDQKEEDQTFSLLNQFGDTVQATENSNPRPLSGLFGAKTKASTEVAFVGRDVGDDSSESENSSEEADSSEEEMEVEEEEVPQSESSKLDTSAQDADVTAIDSEDENMDNEDESDNDELERSSEDEPDIAVEGKNHSDAGRPDVRFTKEQWLDKWQDLRSTIVRLYKKKHKDAVKNKKLHSEAKRRKEFVENSNRTHWFRKKKNANH